MIKDINKKHLITGFFCSDLSVRPDLVIAGLPFHLVCTGNLSTKTSTRDTRSSSIRHWESERKLLSPLDSPTQFSSWENIWIQDCSKKILSKLRWHITRYPIPHNWGIEADAEKRKNYDGQRSQVKWNVNQYTRWAAVRF